MSNTPGPFSDPSGADSGGGNDPVPYPDIDTGGDDTATPRVRAEDDKVDTGDQDVGSGSSDDGLRISSPNQDTEFVTHAPKVTVEGSSTGFGTGSQQSVSGNGVNVEQTQSKQIGEDEGEGGGSSFWDPFDPENPDDPWSPLDGPAPMKLDDLEVEQALEELPEETDFLES